MSALETLIHPHSTEEFFEKYWEQQPLVIEGAVKKYKDLYSLQHLKNAVKKSEGDGADPFLYSVHLNVCRCVDDVKEMLEPKPRPVTSFELNEYFDKHSATFQVLQPQQHTPALAKLLGDLEQYFGCLVGSNVYITPPNSKGLAPHFDDVEVFIIQLEGEKKWNLHRPLEELPAECSGDLHPSVIGPSVIEVVLHPGDLLYFPRGWIHHAETNTKLSSHLTISTFQKNSYFELLQTVVPLALQTAFESDVSFRRGLPLDVFSCAGLMRSSQPVVSEKFTTLLNDCRSLVGKLLDSEILESSLHQAVDHLSLDFIQSCLPPSEELMDKYLGEYRSTVNEQGCYGPLPDNANVFVRVIHPSLIRLTIDEGNSGGQYSDEDDEDDSEESGDSAMDEIPQLVANPDYESGSDDDNETGQREEDSEDNISATALVLYSTRNSVETHMRGSPTGENALRFALDVVPAILFLLQSYPKFVKISDIPLMDSAGQKTESMLGLCVALWSCGLLITTKQNRKRQNKQNNKTKKKPNKKQRFK